MVCYPPAACTRSNVFSVATISTSEELVLGRRGYRRRPRHRHHHHVCSFLYLNSSKQSVPPMLSQILITLLVGLASNPLFGAGVQYRFCRIYWTAEKGSQSGLLCECMKTREEKPVMELGLIRPVPLRNQKRPATQWVRVELHSSVVYNKGWYWQLGRCFGSYGRCIKGMNGLREVSE